MEKTSHDSRGENTSSIEIPDPNDCRVPELTLCGVIVQNPQRLVTEVRLAENRVVKNTPSVAQGFEWIAHGDATARRRARAHVTRGFRRAKAAQVQTKRGDENVVKQKERESRSSSSSDSESGNSIVSTARSILLCDAEPPFPLVTTMATTLGSGRTDPFAVLPIDMSPETHALLDHYFFAMAPISYAGDQRASFQPVKSIIFSEGITDPSIFHLLLAASANDIAYIRGQQDSVDVAKHRGIALSLIKSKVVRSDSVDATLAAVALLAGFELLFGTPQNFNTHMDGLQTMLNLRGGLESYRASNHQLYAIVSWFDCSGSCNLLSKRRFTPIKYVPEPLYTPTDGVPDKIVRTLPFGYDLYKEVVTSFRNMHRLVPSSTLLPTHNQNLDQQNLIQQIERDLYRSLLTPDTECVRSRRNHIYQSCLILPLLYACLLSQEPSLAIEFLYRLTNIFSTHTQMVQQSAQVSAQIFRLLSAGEPWSSDTLRRKLEEQIGICMVLEWSDWRDIKVGMLKFLVGDDACRGPLQEAWKGRLVALGR